MMHFLDKKLSNIFSGCSFFEMWDNFNSKTRQKKSCFFVFDYAAAAKMACSIISPTDLRKQTREVTKWAASMGTRGSRSEVLCALRLQTWAQLSVCVCVRLSSGSDCCDAQRSDECRRTVRAHFHVGTWSRRADKQARGS